MGHMGLDTLNMYNIDGKGIFSLRPRLVGIQILGETFQIQILHRNVSLVKQRESVKPFGYGSRFSLK